MYSRSRYSKFRLSRPRSPKRKVIAGLIAPVLPLLSVPIASLIPKEPVHAEVDAPVGIAVVPVDVAFVVVVRAPGRPEGEELRRERLLPDDIHRAREGVASVEKPARPLQHFDELDVVHLEERRLGLGSAVEEHEAAREGVEAADVEEVGDAVLGLDIDVAHVDEGVAENPVELLASETVGHETPRCWGSPAARGGAWSRWCSSAVRTEASPRRRRTLRPSEEPAEPAEWAFSLPLLLSTESLEDELRSSELRTSAARTR